MTIKITLIKGDGGVADAVRYTKQTGIAINNSTYIQKATDRIAALKNWLTVNPGATPNDKNIVNIIIEDLTNAINNI